MSPEYLKQIRTMHSLRVWGDGGHKYAKLIRRLIKDNGVRTVLDYGCGAGTLKGKLFDVDVREYDPGVPGKDSLPDAADLVVCTDVLEHIEPEYIDRVLDHLRSVTLKVCFAVISTRQAHSTLPNGLNAHLIVEDGQWWLEKLDQWNWKLWINRVDKEQLEVILKVV